MYVWMQSVITTPFIIPCLSSLLTACTTQQRKWGKQEKRRTFEKKMMEIKEAISPWQRETRLNQRDVWWGRTNRVRDKAWEAQQKKPETSHNGGKKRYLEEKVFLPLSKQQVTKNQTHAFVSAQKAQTPGKINVTDKIIFQRQLKRSKI